MKKDPFRSQGFQMQDSVIEVDLSEENSPGLSPNTQTPAQR